VSDLDNNNFKEQPDEESNLNDFPFSTEESESDPFAAFSDFTSETNSESSEFPFSDGDASGLSEIGEFPSDTGAADISETAEQDSFSVPKGKKGKKSRGKTKSKTQKAQVKREPLPIGLPDYAILVLGILFLFLIVVTNIGALIAAGLSGILYIILVDILGVCLLAVPYLLWNKRRNGEVVNLFEVLLGLSLSFVILACIILLTVQAKYYGTHIKAKAAAVQVDTRC